MSNTPITPKGTEPANILKLTVKSNVDDTDVSLLGSGSRPKIKYFESITMDSIKVECTFVDAGFAVDGKSVLEGLPLVGTEEVELKMEDNYENEIKLEKKNALYVNKVTPLIEETNRNLVNMRLVPEEVIRNEQGESRINIRMDGKISDHIKKIFEDYLKTEKKLDIEETSNNYNFIGNGRKSFYTLNWLSRLGIPSKDGKRGDTAGFLFFQTSEGYHFKSIDAMFAQKPKKSFVYNEHSDSQGTVPAGYDGKILMHSSEILLDAQERLKMGAYQTRLVVFDPFNCAYDVIEQTAKEAKKGTTTGGKRLPQLNEKFKFDDKVNATRTTFMLLDTGSLPTGDTDEQIDKNALENFESQTVLNQAIRRYNQLYSVVETITIPGDFSLHAGDVIFIDFPSVKAEKDDEVDKESGGKYIISDLCHLVDAELGTFTKLSVVRDTVGRKGTPTQTESQ